MRDHEHWMWQALEMASNNPRSPFGTVIVHAPSQSVLASGCNHTHDSPIWHGEMDALSNLDREAPFTECVLYTTAEPCPMCQGAILFAGIPQVVYGSSMPFLQSIGWEQIELRAAALAALSKQGCRLLGGVLEAECDARFRQARELRSQEEPGVTHPS
jgi:tRNA(Arg) A34 adenosine deaminase TadA